MIKFIKNVFIVCVVIYTAVLYLVSSQAANFLLTIMILIAVPLLILRQVFLDKLYRYSINIVSKQFIIGNNALSNEHCTVKYTPDEKIMVVDNFATKKREKRIFTIKKGEANINKCWNKLCRVYDSFITLDSLASFFSYEAKINIITLEKRLPKEEKNKEIKIDTSYQGPKFVEMTAIQPDISNLGLGTPNKGSEEFININNLNEQKSYEKQPETAPEFKELGEVFETTSTKLDINSATAVEIALLPGINIIVAKKIVEYRDKNGLFKDVDEFIKVADIKEHFIEKIRPAVIAGKPVEKTDDEEYLQGRIIDL